VTLRSRLGLRVVTSFDAMRVKIEFTLIKTVPDGTLNRPHFMHRV